MAPAHLTAAADGAYRDAFGHWLSGFTDGEGCFYLGIHSSSKFRISKWGQKWGSIRMDFSIALRQDDIAILREIREFLGVGVIWEKQKSPHNGKPTARFQVTKAQDLISAIIPQFERFPLRSKKARDFLAFRRGVELIWQGRYRRRERNPGQRGGMRSPFSDEEKDQFRSIVQELRDARKYEEPKEIPPPIEIIPVEKQLELFTYS